MRHAFHTEGNGLRSQQWVSIGENLSLCGSSSTVVEIWSQFSRGEISTPVSDLFLPVYVVQNDDSSATATYNERPNMS
jgi:hypothetical protein